MTPQPKPWYRSKTVIAATLALLPQALAFVLPMFGLSLEAIHWDEAAYHKLVATLLPALVLVLRMETAPPQPSIRAPKENHDA